MSVDLPEYLSIEADHLGRDVPVSLRISGSAEDIARDIARSMILAQQQAKAEGRAATMIIPVGPVDQFPVLAETINEAKLDFSDVMLINMDEYLTEQDHWVDIDHPLSFRGYMNRKFYDLIDPALAPRPENRVFPDPENRQQIGRMIADRGGVDVCYGGIGINGHMAFNEPDSSLSATEFAELPTRVLTLTRETRTINSVTVGGEIAVIPRRAITVGMREILQSKRCRFYCNRPWQSAVVRRVLHGPITAACPASLLRTHPDAAITVTDFVAEPPDIRLR